MLLLLSAMQGSFWNYWCPGTQARTFCGRLLERLHPQPLAVIQDPEPTQPTCPSILSQIYGLFAEEPRGTHRICRRHLEQNQVGLSVPVWRSSRLGRSSWASSINSNGIWCRLCPIWRCPRLVLLRRPQAVD